MPAHIEHSLANRGGGCYTGGMTSRGATADSVWKAFRGLSKKAREQFLQHLFADRRLREDLLDLALIEERRSEKSRPLSEFLAQRRPASAP